MKVIPPHFFGHHCILQKMLKIIVTSNFPFHSCIQGEPGDAGPPGLTGSPGLKVCTSYTKVYKKSLLGNDEEIAAILDAERRWCAAHFLHRCSQRFLSCFHGDLPPHQYHWLHLLQTQKLGFLVYNRTSKSLLRARAIQNGIQKSFTSKQYQLNL